MFDTSTLSIEHSEKFGRLVCELNIKKRQCQSVKAARRIIKILVANLLEKKNRK